MTKRANYKWRPGSRIPSGVSAEAAAVELDRIKAKAGVLTPRLVVDEARPKAAPLHGAFEWNNSRAGELFREYQARNLIASVHVVYADRVQRAFIHVSAEAVTGEGEAEAEDDAGSYERIEVVVADDGMLKRAFAELVQRLNAAKQSLADVQVAAAKVSAKTAEMQELEEIGLALMTALAIANRRK